MGMATEPGAHKPRQTTELQQILLRTLVLLDGRLRATLGLGQGGCHIQGDKELFMGRLQHLAWMPVLLIEMFPSWAGFVPRLRKPPRLPRLLSRLCPAAGRCSPGSPCLTQLSSWPWIPGLAGHAPVPLTLAKPVLGSCPVPRCSGGSVTGSALAPSPAQGAAPAASRDAG